MGDHRAITYRVFELKLQIWYEEKALEILYKIIITHRYSYWVARVYVLEIDLRTEALEDGY